MADALGYYAEEGVDVTFLEGGPGVDGLEQVVTGAADVLVTAPEQILQARSEGQPVVAIATIYRKNPFVLVSLASSQIHQPQDLLGKTVALGNIDGLIQVKAMMENLELDISKMNIVPYDVDLAPFYAGEIDVVPAFAAGSLIVMKQEREDFNLIWPGDYGVHIYSDTLVITEALAAANPDLVTRFLRATLRGHRTAIEDPETAVSATLAFADDVDADVQRQMVAASLPLIHTGQDQIGWMRPIVWRHTYDLMLNQNLLANTFPVDEAYTHQFLSAVYGEMP